MHRRLIVVTTFGALLAVAAPAASVPGPGSVEVSNESGAVVGTYAGNDALAIAIVGVGAGRVDDGKAWSVVAGPGTYGDVLINEPNLTVRAADGAAVTLSGPGAANNTGGGCIDITRGNVTVAGLSCVKPAGRGVEVRPSAAEGGVVLRKLSVSGSLGEGIAVTSGGGVLIEDVAVTGTPAKIDGLLLTGLVGAGPYRVQGGAFRANGGDGIDLAGAQRVQIIGARIEANGEHGIEIAGPGNGDIAIDGVTSRANKGSGLYATGGAAAVRVVNSMFSRNAGAGVLLGKLTGTTLDALAFDGSNAGADLRLSNDVRTGGAYTNLRFIDTPVTLPLEPRGVLITSATAAVRRARSPLPRRTTTMGRYLRVRDLGTGTSVVRIRFHLTATDLAQVQSSAIRVFEDDPGANKKRWLAVRGSGFDTAGSFAGARLGDRDIASGSDARYALYSPIGPKNRTPTIGSVFPAANSTWVGRDVVVSGSVSDDSPLATRNFSLVIDGRYRSRIELRNGSPVWPLVRVPVGVHTATLTVTDLGGLTAIKTWNFTAINRTPQVKRLRSTPRPKAIVRSRGIVRFSVLIGEDEAIVRDRVNLKIDGRRVAFRIRGKRLVGRVTLSRGRHTIQVVYTDLDGAQVRRGWRFRTVRP